MDYRIYNFLNQSSCLRAAVHGVAELDTTEWLNWTELLVVTTAGCQEHILLVLMSTGFQL